MDLVDICKAYGDISKIAYHGTGEEEWKKIRRHGIKPGHGDLGRAAYLSPDWHGPHLYAHQGDYEDRIRRAYGESGKAEAERIIANNAKRAKRKKKIGRIIAVDDRHPELEGKSYLGRSDELLFPKGVPAKHITHSQRTHKNSLQRWRNTAERKFEAKHGPQPGGGYDNPARRKWFEELSSAQSAGPLGDPEIAASIQRSQERRKAVIAANKERHPSKKVLRARAVAAAERHATGQAAAGAHAGNVAREALRAQQSQAATAAAARTARRAAVGGGAALGATTLAGAGMAARNMAQRRQAVKLARRSRNMKLAAGAGALGLLGAGGAAASQRRAA